MDIFKKCNHQWNIIQDTTTKSRAEVQGECTGVVSSPANNYHHKELYSRKHITIIKCNSCGKLKRYVEEI